MPDPSRTERPAHAVLLVGQSLELHRQPLAAALAGRAPAPLRARAGAQVHAGADALDLNAGVDGRADDLAWAAALLRPEHPGVPLFLDAADPATLAAALDACARAGVVGPLVANALPAEDVRAPGGAALVRAAAAYGADLVIAPRHLDRDGVAAPDALAESAREAVAAARTAGVSGWCYVDCLAYPPALDPVRARRSLALLRTLRGHDAAVPLVAVGNVGHGAPAELRGWLRVAYAAAAVGAGAGALLLPVEEPSVMAAVALARGARTPADADPVEGWLAVVAAAAAAGTRVPPAPPAEPALATAARLLFG